MSPRRVLVLILAAAALYGHCLEFPDFWGGHWESRRALIGRTMLEGGDWIVPRQNGEVTLDKPPLYYWTVAGAMAAAGDGERGARLPSVFAAILGLALTWRVGVRLGGDTAAFWAVFFLAVNPLYWGHARTAEMDMLLLAVELGAVWAFLRARDGARGGPWPGWALIAAAFLIKGPVGVVVPVAVIVVYAIADRMEGAPPRGWVRPLPGLLLCDALVLPWFVTVLLNVPDAASVFSLQAPARYGGGLDHLEPFWFYGPVLLAAFLPGTLYVPLWIRRLRGRAFPERSHLRRLGLVLLALLVFFSLSTSRRVYYILPLWPLLALGVGLVLSAERRGRWLTVPTAVLCAGLGLAGPAAGVAPLLGAGAFFLETPVAFLLLGGMAGIGGAGAMLAARGRWTAGLVAAGVVLALAEGFVMEAVYPVSNAYRSRAAFVREAVQAVPDGEPLAMYREDSFAYPFYAGRTVPDLRDTDALHRALDAHPRLFVIVDPGRTRRLRDAGFRVTDRIRSQWIPPGARTPRDLSLVTIERFPSSAP